MEWGDRGDELPWHGDLRQNPGCRFDFQIFHSTFHFPTASSQPSRTLSTWTRFSKGHRLSLPGGVVRARNIRIS